MKGFREIEVSSPVLLENEESAALLPRSTSSAKVQFDVSGWISWRDREDLSAEFIRLLAAAQEGGSTASECWLTASRIDFADDRSWTQEWIKTAQVNETRAETSSSKGKLVTARHNWLRAVSYYQAAACPVDLPSDLMKVAVHGMRRCAKSYVESRSPAGEVVSIPWLGNFSLQGYFLPSISRDVGPVVICLGEPGSRKEEYLFKVANHAFDRGMSLLAVDLLGKGDLLESTRLAGGRKLEAAIGHIVDYLVERPDVDATRIAILADGWGSSFVASGVAADSRFAAAVCDGGVWDLHERAFLRQQATGEQYINWFDKPNPILTGITCPLLVTAGESGWLPADDLSEFGSRLGKYHRDATFKLFVRAETAAMQGHLDNPTLANEMIFDWIEDRLGLRKRLS